MFFKLIKVPQFVKWIFPKRVWDFSHLKEKKVYLTFDDGPIPEVTEWILDFLKKENIEATFFCVGENIIKNKVIFQRIKAEGHQVGNHSFQHENGLITENKIYFESVYKTETLTKTKLFRPPYGKIKNRQAKFIMKTTKLIMWTFLTYDYSLRCPKGKILKRAKARIKDGEIIVFHDSYKAFENMKVLLPAIVKICREKELGFGRIE